MADRKGQREGQHGAATVLLCITKWLNDIIGETCVTYMLLCHCLDPADVVGLEGGGVAATAVEELSLGQQ